MLHIHLSDHHGLVWYDLPLRQECKNLIPPIVNYPSICLMGLRETIEIWTIRPTCSIIPLAIMSYL
jgi:hypothetical protein